jgi:hypothetical protein
MPLPVPLYVRSDTEPARACLTVRIDWPRIWHRGVMHRRFVLTDGNYKPAR